MSFRTRIQTPEGVAFDAETEGLILPGTSGLFGILTGHAPMLAALAAGVMTVRQAGGTVFVAIGDGAVEIRFNTVSVATESAAVAATESEAEEKLAAYLKQLASAVPSAVEMG